MIYNLSRLSSVITESNNFLKKDFHKNINLYNFDKFLLDINHVKTYDIDSLYILMIECTCWISYLKGILALLQYFINTYQEVIDILNGIKFLSQKTNKLQKNLLRKIKIKNDTDFNMIKGLNTKTQNTIYKKNKTSQAYKIIQSYIPYLNGMLKKITLNINNHDMLLNNSAI